jgi:serpin B
MHRREFVLGAVVGAVLAACSSDGGARPAPSTAARSARATSVRSQRLRQPSDGNTDAAVATVNGLGVDLYQRLATAQPNANLVLSPASIAIATAMAREGALGVTATQMDKVLHSSGPANLAPSMNALDQALRARSGARPDPSGTGSIDVTLKIANSLWGQQDIAWMQAFLDRLAEFYGAGLQLTDFKAHPDQARSDINAWVSEQTAKRIPELLPSGVIDQLTRLVLVNAVYLKAPWLAPFDKAATTSTPFNRAGGGPVNVAMMHSNGQLAYAEGDGWQAVDLPYAGYELTMTAVLPAPGRQAAVESLLSHDLLDSIIGSQTLRQVTLGVPRWKTQTALGLADALRALGMPSAFDPDTADFGAMTDAERLYLSAVQHQANITVDEAGTEAAAATAAVISATAAPAEEPVKLVLDRPFLFLIRDVPTGAIVFLGRVADPS